MTIILFLLDTSSSMCQKAYVNGVQKTYLDIAKGAVETFLKFRQRTQDCLGDRYMLLTFEEPPANIKAGWKENHATFMNELKNLQSTGLTTMGESLKNAFDLLNLNRMQSGIDTYGQGRCPFYLEPSVIIVITDGGRYSYRNGVHPEIILPLSTQIPGTKFTKEPFRWDQRLFSLVLRMSGNRIEDRIEGKVPHDDSPIERMCEVTGGRSYRVRSHFVLNQCLESLVQKVQPGVVLQFEPMLPKEGAMPNGVEPNSDIVFQPTKKMIYVQKHISQKTFPIGYWPLPEPYWPDPKALTLHPRDAHPKLKVVTTAVDEPQMVRSFPVDKYDIEAGPLTFQILQKREINKCWQVIISNGMHGFELPFGYLKATPNFTQVHLYVLAYNYPALLPLLNDLIHKYNMSPPTDLMYKFNAYVRSIPPYYCPFLRKALHNINVPYPLLQFLLPENVDNYLSPNIANQLKIIKNTAKQDQENLCLKVFKQLKQPKPPYRQVETAKLNTGVPLRRDLVRHPLLRDTFAKLHAELEPIENFTVVVPQMTRQASAKSYRNPFDIPRRDLIEEIARMRETFLRPTPTSLVAKDSGHCLPIAEMGNYQEYLKNKDNPLREIEPTNVRQHMFGNPYKKDKHMVMVDEADLGEMAPIKASGAGGTNGMSNQNMSGMKKLDARARKRKAGPIRKDFVFRRNSTDQSRSSSPACSTSSGMLSPMCASPAPSNSSYDMSDYDDDSMSDCSSNISNDDAESGRLVMSFDFNEEENTETDFPLNGYVRNFINGINEEASVNCAHADTSAISNNNVAPGNLMLHMSANMSNVNAAPAANSHILLTMNSNGNLTVPVVPTTQPSAPQHPYMNNYAAATARTASTILSNMPAVQAEALPAYAQVGVGVAVNGIFYAAPGATQTAALPATNVQHLNGGNMYGIPAVGLTTNAVNNAVMPQLGMYNQAQQQQQQQAVVPIAQTILQQPQTQLQQQTTQQQSQQATTILAATTAATTTIQTMPQAHLGVLAQQQQQQQPPQQQQQAATAVAGSALHIQHTDINDAQAISRILQQCHNGNINSSSNNMTHNSSSNNITYSHNLHDMTAAAAQTNDIMVSDVELMPPPLHQHNVQNNYDHAKVFNAADHHLNHHALSNNGIGNAMNYQQTNNKTTNVNNQQQQQQQRQQRAKAAATKTVKVEPLTEEQREVARKHNMEIRTLIFRDIRRPGRNYTQLLDHLNLVKGDFEMQSHFVDMCITESQRFRRRQMVHTIEGWWQLKKKLHKSLQQQPQQQPHILTATS